MSILKPGDLFGEGNMPSATLGLGLSGTGEGSGGRGVGIDIGRIGTIGATCDEICDRLRQLPGHVSSAMLVGHNPAAQMLALRLTNHDTAGREEPEREK